MKISNVIKTIAFAGIYILSGCDIDSGTNKICTYNARIENEYVFPEDVGRIQSVRDYLFDSNGILRDVSDRNKDALQHREIQLGEGDYTLVSWANMGKASQANAEVVGETRLEEMFLSVDAPSKYAGYSQNSEKLYFGTLKFRVEQTGVSHCMLLMRRAYASLKMTIKWAQTEQIPEHRENFNLRLLRVHSKYVFGDPFSLTELENTNFATPMKINEAGELEGELVSYRYSNKTRQLLRLYNGDTPVTGELDLTPLFEKLNINLDATFRQDYKGSIELNGNKISIILNEELQNSH